MHEDWGERAARWRGIRSETVDVQGTAVHLLRADGPAPGATDGGAPEDPAAGGGAPEDPAADGASHGSADGPTQVLVHGLGGCAANWLEVIPALARRGPVIAPDLPGFGRTEPPHPRASRIHANVGFLGALLRTLDLDEVELHGNSMGGLVATLFAAKHPEQVTRLVLVDPALPGPRKQLHRLNRTTLTVFAPFVIPRLGRRLLGKLYASRTTEELLEESQHHVHGDASRVRPELEQASLDNLRFGQETTWRLDAFAAATSSIVELMLEGRRVLRAVDGLPVPTLVLWGDRDELIGRPVIDALAARRPDWDLHVFEGIGHMAAIEVPDDYVATVTAWLHGSTDDPTDGPTDDPGAGPTDDPEGEPDPGPGPETPDQVAVSA